MIMPTLGFYKRIPDRNAWLTFYTTLSRPFSTGSISLASADAAHQPVIVHPAFRDARDWAPARTAARFTMRLADEFARSGYPHAARLTFAPATGLEAMRQWELTAPEAWKGFKPAVVDAYKDQRSRPGVTWQTVTDPELDSYLRRTCRTTPHTSSTCRMSADPADGVVDQRLRVHGFRNLRVCDASVFPSVPTAHTMAPVMMTAERCAVFIQDEWKGKNGKNGKV